MKGAAEPLIKYPGGKRWVIKHLGPSIRGYLEATGGQLLDPFFGGGALPLWLGLPEMVVSDRNHHTMELYETVRDRPADVAFTLSGLIVMGFPEDGIPGGISKEDYYRIRDWRPTTAVKRAARILYMSRLSFNGVWRVNSSGDFNVPFADDAYRRSIIDRSERDAIPSIFPNKEKFLKVAAALATSEIAWCDFAETARLAEHGDVLYMDPPYDGTFDGYVADRFTEQDQARLAAEALAAWHRGAAVFVHNSDTPLIRHLYAGWTLIPVKEKRSVNRDGGGRERAPCIVATNHPTLWVS